MRPCRRADFFRGAGETAVERRCRIRNDKPLRSERSQRFSFRARKRPPPSASARAGSEGDSLEYAGFFSRHQRSVERDPVGVEVGIDRHRGLVRPLRQRDGYRG